MKNYSQSQEQNAILSYFGKFKGTFLDIGANDGITFSNTSALSLLGWNGIAIEPSPKAYAKLEHLYRDNNNIDVCNFAIGKEDGVITLKESGSILGTGDVALVSSFDEKEVERFKKVTSWEDVDVRCMTWESFQKIAIKHYDFISMDIEGSEMDVLPKMDISNVKLFCIEWNSKPELKKEYDKYMKGFKVIYTSAENLIYAR
jgi:FkbM family methyltransferase